MLLQNSRLTNHKLTILSEHKENFSKTCGDSLPLSLSSVLCLLALCASLSLCVCVCVCVCVHGHMNTGLPFECTWTVFKMYLLEPRCVWVCVCVCVFLRWLEKKPCIKNITFMLQNCFEELMVLCCGLTGLPSGAAPRIRRAIRILWIQKALCRSPVHEWRTDGPSVPVLLFCC